MLEKIVSAYVKTANFILRAYGAILNALKKLLYWGVLIFFPVVVLWYVIGVLHHKWEFRDDDQFRGAAAIVNDPIDKDVLKEDISYLDQGWEAKDSIWFYTASQGSNLLPYDFFLHLEQADNSSLFRDNEHINKYRYLPQDKTSRNPDALPVGMAKDSFEGKLYMGFTCSACHTSQINYVDPKTKLAKGLRIDGGSSAADLERFLVAMASALETTQVDQDKRDRFYRAVLAEGHYKTEQEIAADLTKFSDQIRVYTEINDPYWNEGGASGTTHYGFSRLDAFGRIYNRVLQHLVSAEHLASVLQENLPPSVWRKSEAELDAIFDDKDQTHLVSRALDVVNANAGDIDENQWRAVSKKVLSQLFNPANAPASYPYLWDIAQHDFVQWTGLVSNGGIGPLGRNVGQVIGVFGTLEWQKKPGWSVSSIIAGQGFEGHYIDFKSSIDKRNLGRVENHLRGLWSPEWPREIWPIDKTKADQGQVIFEQRCASCHANIKRDDPERRVITRIIKVESVGTDPVLANNTVSYKGNSGLIEGEYVDGGVGKLIIEKQNPVASLVKLSTQNVVTSWDPDKWAIQSAAEWAWDFRSALKNNNIEGTIRRGDYEPATTVDPFRHLRAYKARSLNGIWATAPYLHNGSVPSLYELLLPKKKDGDLEFDENGEQVEYRSDQFLVGSREFDAVNIGFRSSGYEKKGFVFDTNLRGNSNAGHEYAAGFTKDLDGKTYPALTKIQRYQLLEYLKTL